MFMNKLILSIWQACLAIALVVLVTACGGGGGSAGAATGGSSSSSGSSGGSTSSGTATTTNPTLTVTLYDGTGATATNVSSTGNNYLRALLLDAQGAPVSRRTVTFAIANSGLATLTQNTALTDIQGIAQVPVTPAGTSSGATTVTASATVEAGGASATGTNDFSVTGIGGSSGTTGSPTLTLELFNNANASTTNVSTGGGNYLRATVKDAAGTAVVGKVVTFSATGSSLTAFTPSAATGLTNSAGVAQVSVAPVSISSSGAGTFSAQSSASGVTVTGTIDYSVSPVNFSLGAIALGNTSLLSAASTSVTVRATTASVGVSGVAVGFSADCGTIQSVVTTNGSGDAIATYSSVKSDGSLCSGAVVVTALANGAATQTANLTVASPIANAITFISATPAQLFIKGSGAEEQSVVKFKVLAGTVPQQRVRIQFVLVENPGGVIIGTGSTTIESDASGEVSIPVFAGTIPGPVKVRARLESDNSVFSETSNLTVFSGPPAQNFFDLAVDTFNIEGMDISGIPAVFSVIVGDRQGNPVPDGTVVNFTTEAGQIAGSCSTVKTNGIARCSANYVSAAPRPANGRVSVMAFTEGVKQFTDTNRDNAYTSGTDSLMDQGDAYRDDNEDGTYAAVTDAFRIPKGGSLACAFVGAPSPNVGNTCTGPTTLATTVRAQMTLILASSQAALTRTDTQSFSFTFRLNSAGNTLLPMPAGTSVAVNTVANVPTSLSCGASVSPSSVPNVRPGTDPAAQLGTSHTVVLTGEGCVAGVDVSINVTSPKGTQTPMVFRHPLVLSSTTETVTALSTTTVRPLNGRTGYTVSSSDTSKATAAVDATTGIVTITGVAAGSTNVTLTDGRGNSATVAVTVN